MPNLVTGPFIPSIIEALDLAKAKGFTLPVVWNSSGFESVEALKLIDPYVDCHLIDLKTLGPSGGIVFCGSAVYADVIVPGDAVSSEEAGSCDIDGRGISGPVGAAPGVSRHLGGEARRCCAGFAAHAKDRAWLSLMVQFVPPAGEPLPAITEQEYA